MGNLIFIMSVPLDLVAWLVQERYIISLFHAARALHAWQVQEYVKIGCLLFTFCLSLLLEHRITLRLRLLVNQFYL